MSDYTKIVDYAAKDALSPGNAGKVVKGVEVGAEFDAISVAVATKADKASPTFTGNVVLPTTTTISTSPVGWRTVPKSSTTSGTLTVAEVGKMLAITGGITINNAVFAQDDCFGGVNDTAGALTITEGAGMTLRLANSTSTGNRTVAARGMFAIWFKSASEAYITGPGVT